MIVFDKRRRSGWNGRSEKARVPRRREALTLEHAGVAGEWIRTAKLEDSAGMISGRTQPAAVIPETF